MMRIGGRKKIAALAFVVGVSSKLRGFLEETRLEAATTDEQFKQMWETAKTQEARKKAKGNADKAKEGLLQKGEEGKQHASAEYVAGVMQVETCTESEAARIVELKEQVKAKLGAEWEAKLAEYYVMRYATWISALRAWLKAPPEDFAGGKYKEGFADENALVTAAKADKVLAAKLERHVLKWDLDSMLVTLHGLSTLAMANLDEEIQIQFFPKPTGIGKIGIFHKGQIEELGIDFPTMLPEERVIFDGIKAEDFPEIPEEETQAPLDGEENVLAFSKNKDGTFTYISFMKNDAKGTAMQPDGREIIVQKFVPRALTLIKVRKFWSPAAAATPVPAYEMVSGMMKGKGAAAEGGTAWVGKWTYQLQMDREMDDFVIKYVPKKVKQIAQTALDDFVEGTVLEAGTVCFNGEALCTDDAGTSCDLKVPENEEVKAYLKACAAAGHPLVKAEQ